MAWGAYMKVLVLFFNLNNPSYTSTLTNAQFYSLVAVKFIARAHIRALCARTYARIHVSNLSLFTLKREAEFAG